MLSEIEATLTDATLMLPLLCSLVAGMVIGFEREAQGKAAGLRTHTLVCFSAALMTLLGLRMADWTAELSEVTQIISDMSRMPHAIITGVGFLGAGVIFKDGFSVHGVTTAATLWLTAALGVVFGSGMLGLAIVGTVLAVVALVALRLLQKISVQPAEVKTELSFGPGGAALPDALEAELTSAGYRVRRMAVHHRSEGGGSCGSSLAIRASRSAMFRRF